MNIGLFGYGKMGKVIEKIAEQRGHRIVAKVNRENPKESVDISEIDVVIEFSIPEKAKENIEFCIEHNLPIVVGTTGWYEHLDELTSQLNLKKGALLHSTNFSLGVNVFFEINEKLAKIMNNFKDYSASVVEIHHTQKLDAPSGTGITLCEGITKNHDLYSKWLNVKKSEITDRQTLSIESKRLPEVPGTHEVTYESTIDKIEIKHTAHSREGFGLGSVVAAEWILDKKGVFTMKDVLKF